MSVHGRSGRPSGTTQARTFGRKDRTTVTDAQCRTAWQLQSLLISYPDEQLAPRLPLISGVSAALPESLGDPLARFLAYASATPPVTLAAEYVATFDHHKRFSPYLTYFTHGDTRNRGMALLGIKHTYRRFGLILDDAELPDHLAVILEFAAAHPEPGRQLLTRYRAGLELLHRGLCDSGSPWTDVVDSVTATLPPLRSRDHDRIAHLAAAGPPDEAVGLDPFAPPEVISQGDLRR
ncbi:nitrate reductase molybdenum cofactor assembly chaperone [Nocardia mexicana]|uniref:Respiratory nitrate reductase chaperone NarJ n=1 Tax=Nocardia mexicana TaxID=279262 RepID=A0A370HD81_9NOCA|nr:nitrate reductase molybdenum cofactor assembly chaperone [Nocardia mexicana]RDI55191.1 respiratory nitrate reductase chaperone NarJ [Nocardia mexicana]